MSSTLIEFTLRKNGALTDPDGSSVLLSDPTGTFGVRRTDTGGTVVADAAAMTRVSTGVYTYPVTDPAAGLTYQWYAEYSIGSVTRRDPFTTLGTRAGTATGFWTSQEAVEASWGDINTATASSLDGVAGPDVATLQRLVDGVDADVDRKLRIWGYGRPDPDTSDDYAVVSRLATDALHWRLEGRRGPDLTAAAKDKIQAAEDEIWDELDEMLSGATSYAPEGIDFPASGDPVVTAPVAIYPTVTAGGRPLLSPVYQWYWDAAAGYWRYA